MEIVVDEEPRFVTVCLCLHFAALLRRSEIETAAHRDRMNARGVAATELRNCGNGIGRFHRCTLSVCIRRLIGAVSAVTTVETD